MKNKLYLVKVSKTWFAYPATVGEREISKEQAAQNWKAGYPEHAGSIEVIDAPEADANGKPLQIAWGWFYVKTETGYQVHASSGGEWGQKQKAHEAAEAVAKAEIIALGYGPRFYGGKCHAIEGLKPGETYYQEQFPGGYDSWQETFAAIREEYE